MAGECLIKLDRRCVPTETISQVYEELNLLCQALHQEDARFEADVNDVFAGENLLPHVPFCIDEDDPLVLSVQSAMAETLWSGEVTAFSCLERCRCNQQCDRQQMHRHGTGRSGCCPLYSRVYQNRRYRKCGKSLWFDGYRLLQIKL